MDDFADLVARVQACRACPRMEGRKRVLGTANGPLRAVAVLVGTAPGRYGAERTGIPFSGDRSGAGLEVLLARVGLRREDVFITNAVLCNPQDARGRNAEPAADELRRCSAHLRETLALVDAPLVVALGRTAFEAMRRTLGWEMAWPEALGRVATYHPGPRVWANPERRARLEAQWDAAFCTVKDQVR